MHYAIGWDVGGWNCDRNATSRDALVILDPHRALVGKPWRGNLRRVIYESASTLEFVARLFELCSARHDGHPVVLAIDTPLAFSTSFVKLITESQITEPIGESSSNPYLYRYTERFLSEHGIQPLSAIKDMIGSQATKGIHVLAKFAPQLESCGIWSSSGLVAIEAYPSPCKRSALISALRKKLPSFATDDENDALTCAIVGHLFSVDRLKLMDPPGEAPPQEGWIWVPRDSLGPKTKEPSSPKAP